MLSTVSESRTIHTYAGASLELIHAPTQEALIEQSVCLLHPVKIRQRRCHQDKANYFSPWLRSDMCKSEEAYELNASAALCDWEIKVASPAQCLESSLEYRPDRASLSSVKVAKLLLGPTLSRYRVEL